jgi:transcriptional regulator with XRE-family HTH domain
MVLLRRVLGDTLRARRLAQQRTLREVSTAAKVSLGYLSEVERGQKEASSELLASICDALGVRLSDLLRGVSDTLVVAESAPAGVLTAVGAAMGADGTAPARDLASVADEPRDLEVVGAGARGPAETGPARLDARVRAHRAFAAA